MWYDSLDGIYLINLEKRKEKLHESTQILNNYKIPFERFEAVELESGIFGLIRSMKNLFTECLSKKYNNVLVLEDDLDIIVSSLFFDKFMGNIIQQRPDDYDLIYLGCNAPVGFPAFYSENLLNVSKGYATHAVIWSRNAMEFLVNSEIGEPLDNFLVKTIQKNNKCYCSYPMLISQRVGYSDINKKIENWKLVLEHRYNKHVRELIKNGING